MNEGNITLMLVDDEEQFLESMSKRLAVRGFNVISVNRGEKALAEARAHPVDVALLDLKMPGLSGEQTLEALKDEHPEMEIIILTGHGSINSAVDCTRKGAYSYLQKPCSLEELLDTVAVAYRKRVQRKLDLKAERMEEILKMGTEQSALAILRRLRELEAESGSGRR